MIHPNTRLMLLTTPPTSAERAAISQAGELCQRRGISFAVDAAQTAGMVHRPFAAHIDALCVPAQGLCGRAGLARCCSSSVCRRARTADCRRNGQRLQQPRCSRATCRIALRAVRRIYRASTACTRAQRASRGGYGNPSGTRTTLLGHFLAGWTASAEFRVPGTRDLTRRVALSPSTAPHGGTCGGCRPARERVQILTRCGLPCSPSAHTTTGRIRRARCGFR